eukprot:5468521-Pleurochrysis_carterae.AAC.2
MRRHISARSGSRLVLEKCELPHSCPLCSELLQFFTAHIVSEVDIFKGLDFSPSLNLQVRRIFGQFVRWLRQGDDLIASVCNSLVPMSAAPNDVIYAERNDATAIYLLTLGSCQVTNARLRMPYSQRA